MSFLVGLLERFTVHGCHFVFLDEFHKGLLEEDPEGAILRHNQFVMQLIPPEKLLVFNVAEGWKPLAKFLGV